MDISHLFAYFYIGQVYIRKEINNMLGGQEQGGISTPRSAPCVLLFRRKNALGYMQDDGWQLDGFYHFTGQGQSFDMQMKRGNKSVRNHLEAGKVLMVFESAKPTEGLYRFQGFMNYVDHYHKDIDASGKKRRVIVFRLAPVRTYPSSELPKQNNIATTFLDLREPAISAYNPLRKNEYMSFTNSPYSTIDHRHICNERNQYDKRTRMLMQYVLQRANGFCECCGYPAPFSCENANPYLEIHYINGVGDYGIDNPSNLIALCPVCHTKAHSAGNRKNILAQLDATAANVENAIDKDILKLVTAAIIRDGAGRILAAQRDRGDLKGLWEFPGGQVKPGETLEQCIAREILEELSVHITNTTPFLKVDYDYGSFFMRLFSFECSAQGIPVLRNHTQINWIEPSNLNDLDWVPADRVIARTLRDNS